MINKYLHCIYYIFIYTDASFQICGITKIRAFKKINSTFISLAGRGPAVDIVHGYKHFEGHSYALNYDFYNTYLVAHK